MRIPRPWRIGIEIAIVVAVVVVIAVVYGGGKGCSYNCQIILRKGELVAYMDSVEGDPRDKGTMNGVAMELARPALKNDSDALLVQSSGSLVWMFDDPRSLIWIEPRVSGGSIRWACIGYPQPLGIALTEHISRCANVGVKGNYSPP